EHGDSAVVRVRDNGMGIAADRLTAIFDLFRQNGQPEGQVSEGLGIGLTLVKQMIELHGGSVVAHSDGPGLGSEFVVRLPLTANKSVSTTEEESAAASSGRLRLLVVDDDHDVAAGMELL